MKAQSVYHLPLSSLQWLLTGLFLAALPLKTELPVAILTGFLGCLVWRFILERKGLKCPRIAFRVGVGVAGLLLIVALQHTLFGLTAGMSFLLLLIALKVLEMRSHREFLLLAFLGFFINLTALFFAQSLMTCCYVGMIFVILVATVVHSNAGAGDGMRFWPLLRYSGALILQAVPMVLIFFFFIPRLKGGFVFQFNKSSQGQSGMSDQIKPGSFAELALNEEVAFRAEFPSGNMPALSDLYWRVAVMPIGQGLVWSSLPNGGNSSGKLSVTGPPVVQRISMEPHAGRWVYALDRPIEASGPTKPSYGGCFSLWSSSSDRPPVIRVISRMGNDLTPLSNARGPRIPSGPAISTNERFLTRPPDQVSPRTRALVASWLAQTHEPRRIVRLALNYFRDQEFRYTLTPGTFGSDGLDKFLFERRGGFCEHYAAAFASLMRIAGLPSRMVAGYQGGEFNPFGSYLTVRQSDAHAWAEVWLGKEGWVRFDPADSIDPSRVEPDTQLASRRSNNEKSVLAEQGSEETPLIVQKLGSMVRLAWDSVNYEWNSWVLGYDQSMQQDLFFQLGILGAWSWKLLALLSGGVLLAIGAVYLTVRQRAGRKDRLLLAYRRLCGIFASAGYPRRPAEGPQDYAGRLRQQFPQVATPIGESFNDYIEARYSQRSDPEAAQKLDSQIKRLRPQLSARLREK